MATMIIMDDWAHDSIERISQAVVSAFWMCNTRFFQQASAVNRGSVIRSLCYIRTAACFTKLLRRTWR